MLSLFVRVRDAPDPLVPLSTILAITTLVACGGGASQSESAALTQALAAEVCVEGERAEAKLYIRNLNDYDWGGRIDFSVDKGGFTYTLLAEDRRSRSGREKPTHWPPESQQTAQPFIDAGDFVWRDPKWGAEHNRASETTPDLKAGLVERLRFFSGITAATVLITEPHVAEWSTDSVPACD